MLRLGGLHVLERPGFRQCSVKECGDLPRRRYRLEGTYVIYVNLCEFHKDLIRSVGAACFASEVTSEEWLVGEVMDS